MLIIALGGEPPPTYGMPKLPIIKDTPAETILQGLVESSRKKENWFSDDKQSAEMRRFEELKAQAAGDPKFSWPEEGWHKAMSREITVPVGDGDETYQVILTIDEGKIVKGKEETPKLFRHATIAVKSKEGQEGRYVDQTEAFTLTRFLGFKTAQPRVQMHPNGHALVFYEIIEEDEEKELRAQ